MFIELVEKAIINCPQCESSFKFNIPSNDDGFQEIYDCMDKLVCPMCDMDLRTNAKNIIKAIRTYNNSARYLDSALDLTGSTVE